MPYSSRFQLADDLVTHLTPIVQDISDPFLESRYVGFVAISAATVYELAVKDIFVDFAAAKHKILGNFTEKFFGRINGRIMLDDLRKDYVPRFGDKYKRRFDKELDKVENHWFKTATISVRSSYGNLITCRHSFVHKGTVTNMTFAEIVNSYQSGKEVIHCLARCMTR